MPNTAAEKEPKTISANIMMLLRREGFSPATIQISKMKSAFFAHCIMVVIVERMDGMIQTFLAGIVFPLITVFLTKRMMCVAIPKAKLTAHSNQERAAPKGMNQQFMV